MSKPQDSRRQTARKPVISPRTDVNPPKKMKTKDLNSSCYRLSRVPQKFEKNKAIQNEKQESYAINYFKNNPDAKDTTPPDSKLEQLEEKLQEELSPSDRFTVLVRQKALRYIVFGENSAEAYKSHEAIGVFYNDSNRFSSALRHLNKAKQLEPTHKEEIEPEDIMRVNIEIAYAHLNLRGEKASENKKHVKKADETIKPYYEESIEDKRLCYKRDVTCARIKAEEKSYDESIQFYVNSCDSLQSTECTQLESANLLVEFGDVCLTAEKPDEARTNYQNALDIFNGFEENGKNPYQSEINAILAKMPSDDEHDQLSEDESQHEEENMNSSQHTDHQSERSSHQSSHHSEEPPQDKHVSSSQSNHSFDDKKSESSNNREEEARRSDSVSHHSESEPPREEEEKQEGKLENVVGNMAQGLLGSLNDSEPEEKNQTESQGFDSEFDKKSNSSAKKTSETGGFDDFDEETKESDEKPADSGDKAQSNGGDLDDDENFEDFE